MDNETASGVSALTESQGPLPGVAAVASGSAKWELLMPGQWVLSLPGDAMAAMVTEGLPGRWLWQAQGKDGIAASRDSAIVAAEAHLPNKNDVPTLAAGTEHPSE